MLLKNTTLSLKGMACSISDQVGIIHVLKSTKSEAIETPGMD